MTISISLSAEDLAALEARASRKGVSVEHEARELIHRSVEESTHPDLRGLGFGSAMAKIWGGFELPEEDEIRELEFTGFDRDEFGEE